MRTSVTLLTLFFASITSAQAATEPKKVLDYATRISGLSCKSPGHTIEISWDSAVSPFGPVKMFVDGKKPKGMLRMGFGQGSTGYEADNFKIGIDHGSAEKGSFSQEATINGQKVNLGCVYKTRLKFLRQRDENNFEPVTDPSEPYDPGEVPAQ